MQQLTPRQAEILALIRYYLANSGAPPTRAEIARELGFRSANAADDHLRALAKKGAIKLTPGASRGIRLAESWLSSTHLPIVGRVAAGNPILCEQHVEDQLDIGRTVFHPHADYLLRVAGMSMRDAGILNGDLLAVHRTPDVTDGQIVIARVNDEVTVKRFRRRGRYVRLEPENPDYATILVDLKEQTFDVEGIGVGVVRNGNLL